MANPFTLPGLGAGLLVAVAGGMHLGESAIDLINPIHFQGPAVHPRDRGAAIDERRIRPSAPAFASLHGWEEGRSAREEDCGGCDALAARDSFAYPGEEIVYPAVERDWEAPVIVQLAEAESPKDEIRRPKVEIERYAYYEVETPAAGDEPTAYEE